MDSFKLIQTIPNLHSDIVRSTSSLKNWFVTGGYDGNITIHNLPMNNGQVISGSDDHFLCVWNLKTKNLEKKIKLGFITQCCLEMSNGLVCIGTTNEKMFVFDQINWKILFTLENEQQRFGQILCLAELSNNQVASSSRSGKIHIWDIEKRVKVQVLNAHLSDIYSIVYHQKKKILISASDDMTIRIWSPEKNWDCLTTITAHNDYIQCLILYQKDFLISSGLDGRVKLWHIETGNCWKIISEGPSYYSLNFLENQNLVGGNTVGNVTIWYFPIVPYELLYQSAEELVFTDVIFK
eukprot:gene12690-6584_t